MSFEPREEMLSFWNWWEKCRKGNQERRDERLQEEEETDQEEENIEHEK